MKIRKVSAFLRPDGKLGYVIELTNGEQWESDTGVDKFALDLATNQVTVALYGVEIST